MSNSSLRQEIYINLDDSGKLTEKETLSVYGGLAFFSKAEKDKFITQYRSIINDIKCKYCNQEISYCDNLCPEIKNTNILPQDKRRLMNYIKKYFIVALVIQNNNVYSHIKKDKSAKGRFTDYSIRRLIKGFIEKLIKYGKINPFNDLRLIINIDAQSTKSNGYYNLRDGLIEEMKYGIVNYNYGRQIEPIIFGNLELLLSYQDSGKSYVVQAADLLAGTIRRTALDALRDGKNIYSKISEFAQYVIILP